jgi:hypothetical protein
MLAPVNVGCTVPVPAVSVSLALALNVATCPSTAPTGMLIVANNPVLVTSNILSETVELSVYTQLLDTVI